MRTLLKHLLATGFMLVATLGLATEPVKVVYHVNEGIPQAVRVRPSWHRLRPGDRAAPDPLTGAAVAAHQALQVRRNPMSQPLVSIVCPFECDFTDLEASVERPILEAGGHRPGDDADDDGED